jgi:hypothetical protein
LALFVNREKGKGKEKKKKKEKEEIQNKINKKKLKFFYQNGYKKRRKKKKCKKRIDIQKRDESRAAKASAIKTAWSSSFFFLRV